MYKYSLNAPPLPPTHLNAVGSWLLAYWFCDILVDSMARLMASILAGLPAPVVGRIQAGLTVAGQIITFFHCVFQGVVFSIPLLTFASFYIHECYLGHESGHFYCTKRVHWHACCNLAPGWTMEQSMSAREDSKGDPGTPWWDFHQFVRFQSFLGTGEKHVSFHACVLVIWKDSCSMEIETQAFGVIIVLKVRFSRKLKLLCV